MFFRFFFFKQKTAYEMRISDWSSDVCSSDLRALDALVKTKLDGTGERLRWLEASREEFESSKDPAIQYAVAVMPSLLEREAERKARAGDALLARPVYLQAVADYRKDQGRSEEHTSELQSLMRTPYAVFCLKKNTQLTHAYTYD